jgi:hypothetical protein
MGKIKGICIVGLVKTLRSRREQALELLPPELHHYLDEDIRMGQWYPEEDSRILLSECAKLSSLPFEEALIQLGEMAARIQEEVYGELASGKGGASRSFVLWQTQHDTGELRRIRELPTTVRFELDGFEHTSREQCLLMTGYFRGTIQLVGHSDPEVNKISCRLWGDPLCAWRATWKVTSRE